MPPRKAKEPVDPATLRRSSRVKPAGPEAAAAPPSKKQKTAAKGKAEKPKKELPVEEEKESKESQLPSPAATDGEEAAAAETKEKESKAAAATAVLQVGDELPDVTVLDQDGNDVNLKVVAAEKTVVVFAYPKASTPGCTRQACGFRDAFPKFEGVNAAVYGLSADTVTAQKKFQEKQNLPYPLLADTKFELLGPLGAKKADKGGITRSYWVIKDGKIATMVINVKPEVSVEKALEEVVGKE
ncbi:thioredoxin-like protein [Lipomyces tetrasporus]|uniref:thioredoxin-dependent peroxiredoxin n=1 Tax=Lipomyces tetrasporus TaxID=54092 RepID=A0AAD7QKW8_9ASCO|nr:thioredoxin-like protein [Lipomyces tetrasporus]KAJ8097111.1 thioredoxin-like protein [Lipomyces tetrasporus]